MKIELAGLITAVIASSVGVGGTAWFNSQQNYTDTREAVIKLNTVAENVNVQLQEMRKEAKQHREEVRQYMMDSNARLKVLESRWKNER